DSRCGGQSISLLVCPLTALSTPKSLLKRLPVAGLGDFSAHVNTSFIIVPESSSDYGCSLSITAMEDSDPVTSEQLAVFTLTVFIVEPKFKVDSETMV
ncbi:hypothetical protein Ancab_022853, partial [Ancistrocladus abbreviatus]